MKYLFFDYEAYARGAATMCGFVARLLPPPLF
jgi:hypothetical protein